MKNILDQPVSYYTRMGSKPQEMNLLYLLTTKVYSGRILAIRRCDYAETRQKMKTGLPFYTPSGLFSGADASSLVRPTGLICLDIDKDKNRKVFDFAKLKDKVSQLPYVAYCGSSVSGEGFFCIVPIADHNNHLLHFRSLQKTFRSMGIILDSACSDISRKRFISYDPEPYINFQAECYTGVEKIPAQKVKEVVTTAEYEARQSTYAAVMPYINIIVENEIDITEDYDTWFRIGCGFANDFKEVGRKMFHRVSQFYQTDKHRYSFEETDRLYGSILMGGRKENPVTSSTFLYYCKKAGLDSYINPFQDSTGEKS